MLHQIEVRFDWICAITKDLDGNQLRVLAPLAYGEDGVHSARVQTPATRKKKYETNDNKRNSEIASTHRINRKGYGMLVADLQGIRDERF